LHKKQEPPLLIELKPSKRLKWLLIAIHALAAASNFANALPLAVKLTLATAIFFHLHFMMKRSMNERCKIKHTEALNWELSGGDQFKPIQILNSTVIGTFAVFLHFTVDSHRQSMLIANDALNKDDYRRFIVRLKITAKTRY
jgi:hypothetical protein